MRHAVTPPTAGERRLGRHLALALAIFLGLLFVGIGLPQALGRVGPNRSYGFRVRETLADPAVWYEVNRVTGWELVATGVVVLAVGVSLYLRHVRPTRILLGVIGTMLLLSQAIAWHGRWLVDRLAAH